MRYSRVLVADIIKETALYFQMTQEAMIGPVKSSFIAHPRHIAMYLATRLSPLSLGQIGRRFGGRDHSTVIAARDGIEAKRKEDGETDMAVRDICEIMTGSRSI